MQNRTHNEIRGQKGRTTFLAADPHKAMQEMMDTIDRVRGVYERETEALEKLDTQGFLDLQGEKLETANLYKAGIEDIIRRKAEMKTIDPAVKKELERMQADFAKLTSKNMNALKRMQRTMGRLGETVQKIAKDSVRKERAISYGEGGRMHEDTKKRVSIGVSETA